MDQHCEKALKLNRRGYLNINVPEHHKMYLKSDREAEPVKDINTYRMVLNFIFKRIWHYIFKERWIFTAPLNFGQFYVAESLNTTGYYRDWKASREKGKTVKSYNFHTSGRKFYIKWDLILSKIINQTYYAFKPYRGDPEELTGKRGLAHWVKYCSEEPYMKDFRGHII